MTVRTVLTRTLVVAAVTVAVAACGGTPSTDVAGPTDDSARDTSRDVSDAGSDAGSGGGSDTSGTGGGDGPEIPADAVCQYVTPGQVEEAGFFAPSRVWVDSSGPHPSCEYAAGFDSVGVTEFATYETGQSQFRAAVRRADPGKVDVTELDLGVASISYADLGIGVGQVWLDTGTAVLIFESADLSDSSKASDIAAKLVTLAGFAG